MTVPCETCVVPSSVAYASSLLVWAPTESAAMKTKNTASPAVEKTIWILRIVPPSQERPIIGREVYMNATKVTGRL